MPSADDRHAAPRREQAPLPQARLDDAQRLACLRLIRSENVGPSTFRELINLFGGAAAALEALPELGRRGGRRRVLVICPRDRAEAELAAAARVRAAPLFTIEPGYPPALAQVEPPPPLLYVKGDPAQLTRPAVAVVGSRQASAGGETMARLFAAGLGGAGFAVVSGLARGIDATAHEASLATGTIAVLAGGPDVVYPPEHADLYRRIAERGCLVTEMPPGFTPRGQDFPRRNRIISGISSGVVVIEAARRSGTLSTARHANEQGRHVFALPGHPLDPRAEGTNDLLKQGAVLVTTPQDVIDFLAPQFGASQRNPNQAPPAAGHVEDSPVARLAPQAGTATGLADADRMRLLTALGPAPVPVDALTRTTGLAAGAVAVALVELSLAGRIEHHPGGLVSLRPGTE